MHGVKFTPTTDTNNVASRGMHDRWTGWVLICFGNLITNHFVRIAKRQFSDTQLLHLYLQKKYKIEKLHYSASANRITFGRFFPILLLRFDSRALSPYWCPHHMWFVRDILFPSLRIPWSYVQYNKLKYIQLTNCFNGVVERCKQDHIGHDLIDINHFHINCRQLIFFFICFLHMRAGLRSQTWIDGVKRFVWRCAGRSN